MARMKTNLTELSYDYSSLPESVREAVRAHAIGIRAALTRAAENVIEIGHRLTEARKLFPSYNAFTSWCEAEFGLSTASVSRFVRVYERFGALELPGVSVSVLYELAALPEGEAEKVLREGIGGRGISQLSHEDVQFYRRALQERDNKIATLEQERMKLEKEIAALNKKLNEQNEQEEREQVKLLEQIEMRDKRLKELQDELSALKQRYTAERMVPSDEEKRLWEAEMHLSALVSILKKLASRASTEGMGEISSRIADLIQRALSQLGQITVRGYIEAEKIE